MSNTSVLMCKLSLRESTQQISAICLPLYTEKNLHRGAFKTEMEAIKLIGF